MGKKTDLLARSDELLLALGAQLSQASATVYRALSAWHKLVRLEEELHKELGTQEAHTLDSNIDPVVDQKIGFLKGQCDTAACDLKKLYNAIVKELPSIPIPDALAVVVQRLNKDYSGIFSARGL